jgi:tRNA(Ile)-lysidine synthase
VSTANDTRPVSEAEADALFAGLLDAPALILAVSGGPDSTALLVLAAGWRKRAERGPKLTAVTVDHGLRPEARHEATAVKALAKRFGVTHRTVRWSGGKPSTGLQEKARAARYRLLADVARKSGASHVLTAHTLDDQGETVLFRMARGSGLTGLAAMARVTPLDRHRREHFLVRPFLDLPKARLIATVRAAGLPIVEDPSNMDPRFTRARLRTLMPGLASEGLGPERLARLARRIRRADAAIEAMVDVAARFAQVSSSDRESSSDNLPRSDRDPIIIQTAAFAALPAEVALRLMGRALALAGNEGPVELGKLEAFMAALAATLADGTAAGRFRRTLAGALVTLVGDRIVVETAPPRRIRMKTVKARRTRFSNRRKDLFTKQR